MQLMVTHKYLLHKLESSVGSYLVKNTQRYQVGTVLKLVWQSEALILAVFLSSLSVWPPLLTDFMTYSFVSLQKSRWWSLIRLTFFWITDCTGRIVVNHRFGLTVSNVWIPLMRPFSLLNIVGIVKTGGFRAAFALC